MCAWVAEAVLVVHVGQVDVVCAATPGKLQHHHARGTYPLPTGSSKRVYWCVVVRRGHAQACTAAM